MFVESDTLEEYISPDFYQQLVTKYKIETGRVPKVPTYNALREEWVTYKKAEKDPTLVPFLVVGSGILVLENNRIPIQFVRDEEIHDELKIISVILLECTGSDVFKVFMNGVTDDELVKTDFYRVSEGYHNAVIDVKPGLRDQKRFQRYRKLVSDVEISSDLDVIHKWVKELTPHAIEYWNIQNVTPNISTDVLDHFIGGGFNDFISFRVTQSDGTCGVGVFSNISDDELYWEFSRRGIGKHIGNNILLEALYWCEKNNKKYFNLGVAYYKWKQLWKTKWRAFPSIRLKEDTKLYQDMIARVKPSFIQHIKSNKERLV